MRNFEDTREKAALPRLCPKLKCLEEHKPDLQWNTHTGVCLHLARVKVRVVEKGGGGSGVLVGTLNISTDGKV